MGKLNGYVGMILSSTHEKCKRSMDRVISHGGDWCVLTLCGFTFIAIECTCLRKWEGWPRKYEARYSADLPRHARHKKPSPRVHSTEISRVESSFPKLCYLGVSCWLSGRRIERLIRIRPTSTIT